MSTTSTFHTAVEKRPDYTLQRLHLLNDEISRDIAKDDVLAFVHFSEIETSFTRGPSVDYVPVSQFPRYAAELEAMGYKDAHKLLGERVSELQKNPDAAWDRSVLKIPHSDTVDFKDISERLADQIIAGVGHPSFWAK